MQLRRDVGRPSAHPPACPVSPAFRRRGNKASLSVTEGGGYRSSPPGAGRLGRRVASRRWFRCRLRKISLHPGPPVFRTIMTQLPTPLHRPLCFLFCAFSRRFQRGIPVYSTATHVYLCVRNTWSSFVRHSPPTSANNSWIGPISHATPFSNPLKCRGENCQAKD